MRTLSVIGAAGIRIGPLPQRMHYVNIVRFVRGVPQDLQVLPGELVGPGNRFEVPVGPVDVVVEEADGKDVRHGVAGEHHVSMTTLQVGKC